MKLNRTFWTLASLGLGAYVAWNLLPWLILICIIGQFFKMNPFTYFWLNS